MNKMVINHLEKLFVTSDASTIVNELEVHHPAAKLLVMAAKAQAGEVGDGTNLVGAAAAAAVRRPATMAPPPQFAVVPRGWCAAPCPPLPPCSRRMLWCACPSPPPPIPLHLPPRTRCRCCPWAAS